MSYRDLLKDPRWQKKRLEILARDKFTCQLCNDSTTELHVHHIDYENSKLPWEGNESNLVTYCKHCHLIVETYKKKYKSDIKVIKVSKVDNDEDGLFFFCMISDINDGTGLVILKIINDDLFYIIGIESSHIPFIEFKYDINGKP